MDFIWITAWNFNSVASISFYSTEDKKSKVNFKDLLKVKIDCETQASIKAQINFWNFFHFIIVLSDFICTCKLVKIENGEKKWQTTEQIKKT